MMQVKGVVSRVEAGYAWVDVTVAQGCGRCHEPGGCGGVNIARPFAVSSQTVRVLNPIDAQPGEPVLLAVDDRVPLKAALAVYALPIGGVLVGAAVGTAMASASANVDLLAGIGALAGGVIALLLGRRLRALHAGDVPLRLEKADDASDGCRL